MENKNWIPNLNLQFLKSCLQSSCEEQMPVGKPFVNSEIYNAKRHSRDVLVCVAIVAWPSSYKHTNERRLLFPFLSQTSHIFFFFFFKVQMNKSKWSLKDSYHIRENNGGIHLALPRSCLWGQAQLCPLCSASLPTLETTVFPKSQVFPWQFPWQCWNGSGIERTGGRGVEGQRGEMKGILRTRRVEEGQPLLSPGNLFVKFL